LPAAEGHLPAAMGWRIGTRMLPLLLKSLVPAVLMSLSGLALAAAPPAPPPALSPPPEPEQVLIPTATVDDSLEITGDAIDAEEKRNRLFIDVRINEQGPYRFLVDSGADRSVVGSTLADQLQLPAGEIVRIQGMAGSAVVRTVMIDQLSLGKTDIGPIRAPALAERDLGAQGLIGIDALADQRLLLDFEAQTIIAQDGRRTAVSEPGEIVVTARLRKGQLIITEASIGNQRISAVIDTGSEVTLGNMALRRRLFGKGPRRDAVPMTLTSVTGQTLIAEAMLLSRVRVGGVYLDNVMVAFADAPPFKLFGLDTRPAVFLGSDLLQAFKRVSLDFRNRKVRFALRR